MVRAFIALELSEEIRNGLAKAQDLLRPTTARMTFVDPRQIHITVKFLGEVDERQLPGVMDALKDIRSSPFTVTAREVTVNSRDNPRTVWSSVRDGGKGEQLLSSIEKALVPMGFAPESRRFKPHATLARIKFADPSLFRVLKKLEKVSYGTCEIGGFRLKKSTLTPHGPVYEDLLEVTW